ncbi:hypothetical protein Bbelb_230190 [Branchiostoma belcheri]|nr:hypothetical protein Bbelb_230190 [Branchiostoma belcheri]
MQTQGSDQPGHQEKPPVEAWAPDQETSLSPTTDVKVDMGKKKYELSREAEKKKNDEADPRDTTCEKAGLESDLKEQGKWWHVCVKIVACFLGGILFGIALEKTRVFEPNVIRDQFVYRRFIMMKAFLAAMATGLLCLGVMATLPVTRPVFHEIRHVFIDHQEKGVVTSVVGGTLLGAGMTISGACPGMVLAQVGAGVGNGAALLTLLGCLVGVALYAAVEPWVVRYTRPAEPYKKRQGEHRFDCVERKCELHSICSYIYNCVKKRDEVEHWVKPWQSELCEYRHVNTSAVACVPVPNGGDWTCFMSLRAWPPWIGGILIGLLQLVITLSVPSLSDRDRYNRGMLIGLLQLVITLSVGDTLGGSSSYCTVVSQVLVTDRCPRILIGLLQLVITLSVGDTLGGSSSYCTVVSQVLVTDATEVLRILIGLLQLVITLSVGDTLGGSSSYCTVVSQVLVTDATEVLYAFLYHLTSILHVPGIPIGLLQLVITLSVGDTLGGSSILIGLLQLVITLSVGDTLGGSSSYCTVVSQVLVLDTCILIGLLQLVITLSVGDTLGGSSSYCTVVSQVLVTVTDITEVLRILIGLLQLVIALSVGDTLGGSSSYCTVVSQVLVTDRCPRILIGLLQLVITLSVGDTLGGSSSYCTVVSQVLVTDTTEVLRAFLHNLTSTLPTPGILIGILQLVITLSVGDTLGGSSSYCTVVSQVLVTDTTEVLRAFLHNLTSTLPTPGIPIGLLQLVITLSVGDTLGGSSSYCTVMSQVLVTDRLRHVGDTLGGSSSYCTVVSQVLVTDRLRQMSPYLSRYRSGLGNWWQVVYVAGAVVGALISAASSQTLGTVKSVSMASGFFGGLVMLFGARLGAGCTSGHGLSGTALLVVISFFAVAAMFAGGTVVGFVMWAAARADMPNFPLNYVSY